MKEDTVTDIYNIIYEFPLLIAGIDPQKKVVIWNKLCEKLVGYTSAEIESIPKAYEKILPADNKFQSTLDDIIHFKKQEPTIFNNVPVISSNGSIVYINWHVRHRKLSILPDDITWFIGYDVTEQKITADELKKSEERFKTISRATNDAVWDWNLKTGFLWWNNGIKQIFGYNDKDVENHIDWWKEQLHPEDKDRVQAKIYDYIERGESYWFDEYRFKRANGSYANVFDKGLLIKNKHGVPIQMIGGIMDITDKEIFKENLSIKIAQLREYAFFNSHKFRGPLTRLISLTHLLELDTETSDQTKELAKLIISTAEELDRLVKDMANILM